MEDEAIAQSSITQAMLSEPGCVQKALSLLTFWSLNGLAVDAPLLTHTISQMILQQRHRGFSNDVSWGLSFCLQHAIRPAKKSVDALASCDDNCIALQALHLREAGFIPRSFSSRALNAALKHSDFDGPDWFLLYEAHRQNFARAVPAALTNHPVFGDLLQRNVTFYRQTIPAYASIIHPGGAPEWVVNRWLAALRAAQAQEALQAPQAPAVAVIGQDVRRVAELPATNDDLRVELLDLLDETELDIDDADAGAEYP